MFSSETKKQEQKYFTEEIKESEEAANDKS